MPLLLPSTLRAETACSPSSESALHARLKNQEWIFGGAYVAELVRRQYTADTILDIPLLRGDGSLHVVELKRANIKDLVIRRSGHLMLGAAAHHAVSQAQNYLRTMDENKRRLTRLRPGKPVHEPLVQLTQPCSPQPHIAKNPTHDQTNDHPGHQSR